jgi:predicted nucleic acid-binding protein
MIVFIDTGILGVISSPRKIGEVGECQEWFYRLLARGVYVISSDICDYEVRRSLFLNSIETATNQGLINLDNLANLIDFLPITKPIIRHAAQLWAISRRQGMPTANEKNIDADVIIAAQCKIFQQENLGQNSAVATTNIKHLSRFLQAQKWQDIRV